MKATITSQHRIEALKFYGTHCEAYEYFIKACNFAHAAHSIGDEKTELYAVRLAESLAEYSYEINVQMGGVWDDDFAEGVWDEV